MSLVIELFYDEKILEEHLHIKIAMSELLAPLSVDFAP